MITVVNEEIGQVDIPEWVVDLASFRRWVDSDEFPETGRICFLKGKVWVDMSKEQLFTHGQVKNEFAYVVTGLVKAGQLGLFLPDGTRLTNVPANISGCPDGGFVSDEALEEERAWLVESVEGGYVELEGTPDMVLEIISRSSVHKDTVELYQAYWEAGIPEYWLVDARKQPLRFDVLRHTAKGYVATKKQGGWVKSKVFGKSFRLTQQTSPRGHPKYTLEVR